MDGMSEEVGVKRFPTTPVFRGNFSAYAMVESSFPTDMREGCLRWWRFFGSSEPKKKNSGDVFSRDAEAASYSEEWNRGSRGTYEQPCVLVDGRNLIVLGCTCCVHVLYTIKSYTSICECL